MTAETAYALLAGFFGLAFGSFLNVCAFRWPNDESVIRPPSRCPGCGKLIRWYDNVPVLAWIWLRGRCRDCGEPVSIQYPLVEAATGAIWAGMFFLHGPTFEAARAAIFLTLLLGIAVSDARYYIIPDQFSLGGLAIGLGLSALEGGITLQESVIGAAVGYGVLLAVAVIGKRIFKKDAMGGGDVKMLAMIGAFLGPWGVALTLFLGSLFGAVIFGPISMKTKKLVPFGIFLAIGAGVTFGWGDLIIDWYLTFVGIR